jgi:hypothetical protein
MNESHIKSDAATCKILQSCEIFDVLENSETAGKELAIL